MARTFIVSGDGTAFVPASRNRKIKLALLALLVGLIVIPFLLATGIGLAKGIKGDYDETYLTVAQKACAPAPDEFEGYCISLYLRPAGKQAWEDGSVTTTPAGPALVTECLNQGLTRAEMGSCLVRPTSE